MIDYEKRCRILTEKLAALHAQAKWEAQHGTLVKWDVALQNLLSTLEGEEDRAEHARMVTANELLSQAHAALSLERRGRRLEVKAQIAQFLRG